MANAPKEWRETKWGALAALEYGKGLRDYDETSSEGKPFRVFGTNGPIGWHSAPLCSSAGVVVGRKGAYRGIHFSPEPFFVIDTAFYLRPKVEFDVRWAYFQLKNFDINKLDSGSAIPSTSREAFYEIPVALPPYPVQRRIAETLSSYDDLIENNTHRIKILEEMAQMIYREWFVSLCFPGHEHMRLRETPLGRIPDTWTTTTLDGVVEEIIDYRGKTPKKLNGEWSEYGVPALSALNVKQGRLENLEKARFVTEDLYRKWMKSELKSGDILMTSEAPLGQTYFLPETRRYCLSQRVFSIRANPEQISPVLLYFILSSPNGQEQIKARASGTTVLGIRQTDLRLVLVVKPDLAIQRKAEAVLRPFLLEVDVLQRQIANLRQTRDLLLPKLISGEVSVQHLEAGVASQIS